MLILDVVNWNDASSAQSERRSRLGVTRDRIDQIGGHGRIETQLFDEDEP